MICWESYQWIKEVQLMISHNCQLGIGVQGRLLSNTSQNINDFNKHMSWTSNLSDLQWVGASCPDQFDFTIIMKGGGRLNQAANITKEQNSENAYSNEPGHPNHLTVLPKGYCLESRVVLPAFCAMCMQPSPRSLKMLNAERLLLHINMIARRPLNFYICIFFQ